MPTTTHGSDRYRAPEGRRSPGPVVSGCARGGGQTLLTARIARPYRSGPTAARTRGHGTAAKSTGGGEGHGFVAVGPRIPRHPPGRARPVRREPFPVTGARIHRPLLRADTLSRERLNGWLDQAVTGRLALIVAEAGFGKTTLLADWSRQTGRLTAWYRLESDDRDWLTFLRHLVASGRELDPEFAAATYALLHQLGPGGPTQAELVASLVRDMTEFATGQAHGFTLIFDDYHVIDRCEETEPIVRAILERTGPGFSVVIASRAAPRLPLGRLRARGGVARLDGDDLCFDVPEADRLFRDAYHQPIEPDVVTNLIDRTEGWPALLSLVRTTIEESASKSAMDVVHQLSAAQGDLYDYMAEEVTATLPVDVRQFLTRVSLLDWVDVAPAAIVDDRSSTEIEASIKQAEELGLLGRPGSDGTPSLSPARQDFCEAACSPKLAPQASGTCTFEWPSRSKASTGGPLPLTT
jgi:hypothetical protein